METAKQNAKQRYYQKNKEIYKERVKKQREERKTIQNNVPPPIQNNVPQPIQNNQNNTRKEYILNFYSTIKTEYDFMMWVRNIKRVHKALFNQETIQKESEIKKQPMNCLETWRPNR